MEIAGAEVDQLTVHHLHGAVLLLTGACHPATVPGEAVLIEEMGINLQRGVFRPDTGMKVVRLDAGTQILVAHHPVLDDRMQILVAQDAGMQILEAHHPKKLDAGMMQILVAQHLRKLDAGMQILVAHHLAVRTRIDDPAFGSASTETFWDVFVILNRNFAGENGFLDLLESARQPGHVCCLVTACCFVENM